MAKYINVGKIVNTHGIRGEVRVQSTTDSPEERFTPGTKLVVEIDKNEYQPVTVKSHRVHKSFDLLTFEEFSNINDVEIFKNKMLKIDRESLPDLGEDLFYESDLLGLKVVNENQEEIGKIKEVLYLPANDVWVVKRPNKKDLLLPVIESVILDVDIENKVIVVHVLEGLDEDED